jgi:Caspase domain
MTARAFLIAVEDYSQGALPVLKGPASDAELFRQWLTECKKVEKASIYCCADQTCEWRTAGTNREEILDELERFVKNFADKTDEMFFFFSGHGFSYSSSAWAESVDVLVASNFQQYERSGGACLRLQEIQHKVGRALGRGQHYYFLDACRNVVQEREIEVLPFGRVFHPSDLGTPVNSTLFSAMPGSTTTIDSGFSKALVEGLRGKGRAKGWEEKRMFVKFDLLCEYVKDRVKVQEIDNKPGPGKGLIYELVPVPEHLCRVEVANSITSDSFVGRVIGRSWERNFDFRGSAFDLHLVPDDYEILLEHSRDEVTRIDPAPPSMLDLYEQSSIAKFEKRTPIVPPGPKSPQLERARIEITAVPFVELMLRNLATNDTTTKAETIEDDFRPGTYELKALEHDTTICQTKFKIRPGDHLRLDLLANRTGPTRASILKAVNGDETGRVVEFSETLGPMADWDLGLWLTILGASRILAPIGHFRKLRDNLNLEAFDDVQAENAPIYILSAFENSSKVPKIAVSQGRSISWKPMTPVQGLEGVSERRFDTQRGSNLVSIELESHLAITFVAESFPNRATLVVVVKDENVRLRIYQFVLPLHRLSKFLKRSETAVFSDKPLRVVRTMFAAESRFLRELPIELSKNEYWEQLVNGAVPDPIMARIACYELIRLGLRKTQVPRMQGIVEKLKAQFGRCGDTEAISKLAGMNWTVPDTPPLFIDGILALQDAEVAFPLSADKFDFACSWSTWSNGVETFRTSDASGSSSTRKSKSASAAGAGAASASA